MRTKNYLIICMCFFACQSSVATDHEDAQNHEIKEADFLNGDILFQTSNSSQSQAIKLATNSKFSHCGILFKIQDKWMVLEAVQPIKYTLLGDWIAQGENQEYTQMRLKSNSLDSLTQAEMQQYGETFLDLNYDIQFKWTDDEMYCSELVYKIYKRAAEIALCNLRPLKEYNLDSELVVDQLKKRYGTDIPLDELMVSPEDIYGSSLLKVVK